MDQQLDQFGENLKNLWQRIKVSYLPGISGKYLKVISFIAVVVVYSSVDELVNVITVLKSNLTAPLFVKEYFVYDLFTLVSPFITLIGIFLLIRVKKAGWILVTSYVMSALLGVAMSIRFLLMQRENIAEGLITPHSDFIWRDIIFLALISLCFIGFLISKPIQAMYEVKSKHAFIAFAITIFLALAGILFETNLLGGY